MSSTFNASSNMLTIQQGATLSLSVNFENAGDGTTIDLSSATAAMQGRTSFDASGTVFSLTHSSGITLGSGNPNIVISIPAATTAGFTAPLTGVYDLEVVISGTTYRIVEGPFRVTPEVTR